VQSEIVPLFVARGYGWYSDYPGRANWLPLQRHAGDFWPTVELHLSYKGRPFATVDFALLPEVCRTVFLDRPGFHNIPRGKAVVVDAPAFFSLCKGRHRFNDTAFGDASIFFPPLWLRTKLRNEVAELKSLSAWLIEFLDQGIPREWFKRETGGKVHDHIEMSHGSRIFRDPESRKLFEGA
jgi:hypothetical protein